MSGGQWCLGTSVRGTAVPRHECPGGHFAGRTTMPTTTGIEEVVHDTRSLGRTVAVQK